MSGRTIGSDSGELAGQPPAGQSGQKMIDASFSFGAGGAVPLPRPERARPRAMASVARGLVEAVLVDLTRERGDGRFQARIYRDEFAPPFADVVAVWILYSTTIGEVASRLEEEWRERGLEIAHTADQADYRAYDHAHGFQGVWRSIEKLQMGFPP